MDIKSLQLFNHLASSLHFGETARLMYVSPSTLSRSIQRLEQETGAALFVRTNRSVVLTPAGHKLLAFSRKVVRDWQALQAELDESGQALTGQLNVYCSVTASQSHLPRLLTQLRERHPAVELRLVTGDPALALSQVQRRQCDASIAIHTPDFPAELAFRALDEIPLDLIVPRSWGITRLDQLDWRQHQVVMPEHGPTRRIVYHWFAEQGIRPTVYASVGGNEAIVSMVAFECGVGFVPQVVLNHSTLASQVTRIAVNSIEAYQLGLCCLKQRQQEPLLAALFQLELN